MQDRDTLRRVAATQRLRAAVAGFATAEARRFFGARPALPAAIERDYMTPWPAMKAEQRFLDRFAKIKLA